MDVLYRITLRRPDGRLPWGFRLKGGRESGQPVTFREIYPSSISDHCGMRVGDQLVALAGNLTQNLNNAEVQEAIMKAGNVLEIIVERPNREDDFTIKYPQNRNTPSTGARHPWPPTTDTLNNSFDNKSFSEDLFNYRTTNKSRSHSSPPPKCRSFASSPHVASDTEEYTGYPILGSRVQSRYHNLFDANLRPPDWPDDDEDDLDKSRKVRFAEPPESNVIELESIRSYSPSIEWDFNEHPMKLKNYKINRYDDSSARLVDDDNVVESLANEIDNIDLENYFPKKPFVEFEKTFSPPKKEWPYGSDNYPFASDLYYDTFPRSSKKNKKEEVTDLELFSIKNVQPFKPFEENRRFENLSGNQHIFDNKNLTPTNLPKNFDTHMNRYTEFNKFSSDQMRFHPSSSSPLNSDKFKTGSAHQNVRKHYLLNKSSPISQAVTQKMKDVLDPNRSGLFAMLDRSITDKIVNWNRPPNLEQSATYKLLKELESTNPEYD